MRQSAQDSILGLLGRGQVESSFLTGVGVSFRIKPIKFEDYQSGLAKATAKKYDLRKLGSNRKPWKSMVKCEANASDLC